MVFVLSERLSLTSAIAVRLSCFHLTFSIKLNASATELDYSTMVHFFSKELPQNSGELLELNDGYQSTRHSQRNYISVSKIWDQSLKLTRKRLE
ncbi:hypothetical protein A4G99_13950 [Haladaptatus sp. R4]|nr:hypothetical protein A4G99_13950 [Haladaptatus sp. R4]